MRKDANSEAGFLTYGPFEPLHTGKYQFEIIYSSPAEAGNIVGKWNVVDGPVPLNNGSIPGTADLVKKLNGDFTVTPANAMKKIEVRTFADYKFGLKIIAIRIARQS